MRLDMANTAFLAVNDASSGNVATCATKRAVKLTVVNELVAEIAIFVLRRRQRNYFV